jgi:hypothetical protein
MLPLSPCDFQSKACAAVDGRAAQLEFLATRGHFHPPTGSSAQVGSRCNTAALFKKPWNLVPDRTFSEGELSGTGPHRDQVHGIQGDGVGKKNQQRNLRSSFQYLCPKG